MFLCFHILGIIVLIPELTHIFQRGWHNHQPANTRGTSKNTDLTIPTSVTERAILATACHGWGGVSHGTFPVDHHSHAPRLCSVIAPGLEWGKHHGYPWLVEFKFPLKLRDESRNEVELWSHGIQWYRMVSNGIQWYPMVTSYENKWNNPARKVGRQVTKDGEMDENRLFES